MTDARRGAIDLSKGSSEICCIEVHAVDADDNATVERFEVSADKALSHLQRVWGKLWSVPHDVVAFQDAGEKMLLPWQTPRDLGWGASASITAVPVQSGWSVGGGGDPENAESVETIGGDGIAPVTPLAKVGSSPIVTRCVALAASSEEKKITKITIKGVAEAAAREQAKGPPAAQSNGGTEASRKEASEEAELPDSEPKLEPTPPVVDAAKPGKDSMPGEDDAIAYTQQNPKLPGSKSYVRYEQYKKAKSVRQALRKGAGKIDIRFDFARGFLVKVATAKVAAKGQVAAAPAANSVPALALPTKAGKAGRPKKPILKRKLGRPKKTAAPALPMKVGRLKAKAASTPALPTKPKRPQVGTLKRKFPADGDAVVFAQLNPKRPGTAAHERYELYKSAKTVRRAVEKGALRIDISCDFGKGYLSRVGEALQKKTRTSVAAVAPPVRPADRKGVPQRPPADDDRIIFAQPNPKGPGTKSHARYHKYKTARTVKDALAKGAHRMDVAFDFRKGYLRFA